MRTTDIDAFAWWRRKGDAEPFVYEGFDEGLASVAAVLRAEGPFDGAIGFLPGRCARGRARGACWSRVGARLSVRPAGWRIRRNSSLRSTARRRSCIRRLTVGGQL